MPTENINLIDVASKSETEAALNLKQDKIEDLLVIKSASGQKWGFRVDETGMLILPGEQIP